MLIGANKIYLKSVIMEKILSITVLLLCIYTAKAQCPCETKAEFDASDIRVMSGKLEARTTEDFMITVENTGSCGWDKDKVWLEIIVKVRPRDANQSEVNKSFKTSKRHYMTSGAMTPPGETAGFKIRFDPPPNSGRYQITVRFIANGSFIESADSKALDWN